MTLAVHPGVARPVAAVEAADWLVRTHSATWFAAAGLGHEATTLKDAPEFCDVSDVIGVCEPVMRANARVEAASRRMERTCSPVGFDAACSAACEALHEIGAATGRACAWEAVRAGDLGGLPEDIVHCAINAAWGAALGIVLLARTGADGMTVVDVAEAAAANAGPLDGYFVARTAAQTALEESAPLLRAWFLSTFSVRERWSEGRL